MKAELFRNRKRVVDTCDTRHLINRPYMPMTESIEFYAKYAWYDKSLRDIRLGNHVFITSENAGKFQ